MNRVVLVTGASRGIGRAIAIEFAKKSYDVVINYVENKTAALKVKEEIETNYHVRALTVQADVANEEEVHAMIESIFKNFGGIDVLVNNAGIAIDKEFEDRTVSDFEQTLHTNLIGPFLVSKYVGQEMVKRKKGKIINISSTNGINSFFPTSIDYDASKAALINLTHNLALQFAPDVNVNCVAPGWVNTDMNLKLPKELIAEETEKIYKKRFAEPSEIGKVVVFLASEDADFINDAVIQVDGGY